MNNWKETTLGEVAEFSNGRTSPERFDSGKYEVFGSNGVIGFSDETNSDVNTIVIGRVGSYCGSLYFSKNDCWVTDNAIRANAKETSDPFYLYYLLITQKLNSRAVGSGQPLINQEILNSIDVLLPPLPEQKTIAAILSSFDDKIELLRRQNKTLEKIAQTIFKEWFVNFTVNGKKLKINSKTGLPEGWSFGKIKDFGQVVCGKTPPKEIKEYFGGNIPFIKIPNMHNKMFIVKTEDSLTEEGADFQKNKFISKNSICVSCIATVGLVSITSQKSQTNQQINTIIPAKDEYLEYLYFVLKSRTDDLLAIGSGGSATLNINTGIFSNIEILRPTDDALKSFHSVVGLLFEKVLSNYLQIQTLSKLRDTLLPKLVKGEIRVKL